MVQEKAVAPWFPQVGDIETQFVRIHPLDGVDGARGGRREVRGVKDEPAVSSPGTDQAPDHGEALQAIADTFQTEDSTIQLHLQALRSSSDPFVVDPGPDEQFADRFGVPCGNVHLKPGSRRHVEILCHHQGIREKLFPGHVTRGISQGGFQHAVGITQSPCAREQARHRFLPRFQNHVRIAEGDIEPESNPFLRLFNAESLPGNCRLDLIAVFRTHRGDLGPGNRSENR